MVSVIGYTFGGVAPACVTQVREGQYLLVTCTEVGVEGIWSPAEEGSFTAWLAEHEKAHDAHDARRRRQLDLTWATFHARRIYTRTEPGDPLRRGIGQYL